MIDTRLLALVARLEFTDPAGRIDHFLLSGVERMTCGANLDLQSTAQCGTGLEGITTGTGHRDIAVFWMNAGFHVVWLLVRGPCRKKRISKGGAMIVKKTPQIKAIGCPDERVLRRSAVH
jgi:hypothetical protein